MHVVATIDDETSQASLIGYFLCDQFSTPRPVRFYIDSGSTITTLLSNRCCKAKPQMESSKAD